MLTTSQSTTLLQIICEVSLYSQVICESMKVADNTNIRGTLSVDGLNTNPPVEVKSSL